ncbi:MAG TPA: TRC40/GET3/ArsA family transport-energizing ATPase [Acidimicrobiales bacterium]|nr:TRC40/GET3/ArsA family transport-energizing ATPase [Acidimicrobiales bacterium]
MRVLLFTGKGGVGKTTVAAATAIRCAESGRRTIVVSTDPAHSLADAMDRHLDGTPRQLSEGLWGQQLDSTERLEEVWGEVQEYMVSLFDWAGLAAVEAEELAVLPGLDELFALSDINTLASSGQYDVVVVDCAPTAETIRLLSLPDVLTWYMERVFPVERRLVRLFRPVVSRVTSMPVAGDGVFDAAMRLYERLGGVRDLLSDGERTSIRLVVNPEKMVIAEAKRTATYLSLFGYHVDAVVANRLLPEAVADPWFKAWKAAHADHLASIEESFAPLPVLRAELAPEELVGRALLSDFANDLYGECDPAALMHSGPAIRVEADGGERVLVVPLPFVDRDDLEIGRREDELLVRVGPYRRAVTLPDSLRRRQVTAATITDGALQIRFQRGTE